MLDASETRALRDYCNANIYVEGAVGDDVVVLNDITGSRQELVRMDVLI